jgi:hypothetical protein
VPKAVVEAVSVGAGTVSLCEIPPSDGRGRTRSSRATFEHQGLGSRIPDLASFVDNFPGKIPLLRGSSMTTFDAVLASQVVTNKLRGERGTRRDRRMLGHGSRAEHKLRVKIVPPKHQSCSVSKATGARMRVGCL